MLEALEQLRTDAVKYAAEPVWSLSDADLVDCLALARQARNAIAAIELHLIKQIDSRDMEVTRNWRGTASWLRSFLRLDARAARDIVARAATVDRLPNIDAALAAGAIDTRQGDVIGEAVDAIPAAEAGPEVIAAAEAMLLELGDKFAPAQLRRLGGRILEHVAPEVAERIEKNALDRQEERARRKRGLTLSAPFEGLVRVRGCLTVEDAALVSAALDPLCVPRRGDDRTPVQKRADALVDICGLALRTGELPDNGGEPAQMAVTVSLDAVTGRLGRGLLDSGDVLSPAAVRRLACTAQILPAVLDGAGQPLDVGRQRRLYSGPIRRALVLRDRGCAFPDCDRPPRWCDAHHLVPWLEGGPTSVDNGVLLCRRHHRVIHAGEWQVRLGSDRTPEFIPPAYVDQARRPQRNMFHRRT